MTHQCIPCLYNTTFLSIFFFYTSELLDLALQRCSDLFSVLFLSFFNLTNSILKNHKTGSPQHHNRKTTTFTEGMVFFEVSDLSSVRFALHICVTYIYFFLCHNPIQASVIQISWYGRLLHLYSVFRYWTLKANIVLYVVSCCSCKEFRRATFSRQCLCGLIQLPFL